MNADWINAAALVSALSLSMLGALGVDSIVEPTQPNIVREADTSQDSTDLTDARGQVVPIREYRRIASLNTVADHLLIRLLSPDRVVGVTRYTREEHPEAWRFTTFHGLPDSRDVEAVLSLAPDLVISSIFADESHMARLREEGIQVFDLGDMRGIDTTLSGIRTLGRLLGVTERADRLARDFSRQVEALEARVSEEERVPGLYLTNVGDAWFGGTEGSSFGDMLRLAGVDDIAATHGYRDWPQYDIEQLLTLAPHLIVTTEGTSELICGNSLLSTLPACGPTGRIIEAPSAYHSDPGLGLIEAAATIQALVHPSNMP